MRACARCVSHDHSEPLVEEPLLPAMHGVVLLGLRLCDHAAVQHFWMV